MSSDELLAIVKSILYRTRIAESDRCIYQQYCDYGTEYLDGLNLTPAFWTIVTRALVHNMMVELAKIYDQRADVYGIKKLLSICESSNLHFNSSLITGIHQEYASKNALVSNLKNQRNKIWAHSDCNYFLTPEAVENEYNLKWDDIECLIALAGNICNRILVALGKTAESIHYSNTDDVSLIFETMQERADRHTNE